jgi:hypothetical protein
MKPTLRHWLLGLALLACLGAWPCLLWLEQYCGEQPYSFVEDRLYVGASVDVPPPGATAVVNLCDKIDPYPVDASLWEPIDGGASPDMDWFRRVVGFIDARRRAGRTTYVHCLSGMNRSGMVVVAYLMYEHGWDREQALAFARSKRPQIEPNSTLMRSLADWQRALEEHRAAEAPGVN